MAADAPSADELKADPVARAAFATAWANSLPDDPDRRHEEGGYIYCKLTSSAVEVRRVLPGGDDSIDLSYPPHVQGGYLVATYHTHPHPPDHIWVAEPSPEDERFAAESGVPWFVISHAGVFVTGPARRVGGLAGPPGYPL